MKQSFMRNINNEYKSLTNYCAQPLKVCVAVKEKGKKITLSLISVALHIGYLVQCIIQRSEYMQSVACIHSACIQSAVKLIPIGPISVALHIGYSLLCIVQWSSG